VAEEGRNETGTLKPTYGVSTDETKISIVGLFALEGEPENYENVTRRGQFTGRED